MTEAAKPNHVKEVFSSAEIEAVRKWEPLTESFASIMNLNSAEVTGVETGVTPFKGSICSFGTEEGDCYKGYRCYHEHHLDSEKVKENPKMAIPEEPWKVGHFNWLPKKIQLHPGSIYKCRVVTVESPEEFYVTPHHGGVCLCKIKYKDLNTEKFTQLTTGMKGHYTKKDFKNACSLTDRELVAIRMSHNGEKNIYRGVVLSEVTVQDPQNPPKLPVFLMDLGYWVVCDMKYVAPLAPMFCNEPPLAYKCYLYGISPMFLRYSKQVVQRFKELVEGKEVVLICKQRPEILGKDVIDPEPFLVDLRVEDEAHPGKFLSLKEEMVKTKRVLVWNEHSDDPSLSSRLTDMETSILYDLEGSEPPDSDFSVTAMEEQIGIEANSVRHGLNEAEDELVNKELPEMNDEDELSTLTPPCRSSSEITIGHCSRRSLIGSV